MAVAQSDRSIDWSRRIPELDGFRSIAVWLVLIHHFFTGWPIPAHAVDGIPRFVLSAIHKGWLGVDLFFVLSGLLITGILLDSRSDKRYFRNFYAKRALRIVPLYFAVITVCFLLYREPARYFLLSFVFLANFAGALGSGVPHGPGVFWSLAIEEHFYLLWPLIVRFTSRRTLIRLCLTVILLSPALRLVCFLSGMDPRNQIYLFTWFRLDGLVLGALLAIWFRSPICNARSTLQLGTALLAGPVLLTIAGMPFGILGTRTAIGTAFRYTQSSMLFGSAIVFAMGLRGTGITAILRTVPMQISADLSYCIYLIHLSIGDGYEVLLRSFRIDLPAMAGPGAAFWVRCVVITSVAFVLAALSRKFLEQPFLTLKRYLPVEPERAGVYRLARIVITPQPADITAVRHDD